MSLGLIGSGQAKARSQLEQAVLERTADQRLERLLDRDAPFRSDQPNHLNGDAQAFEADCGGRQRCAARIKNGVLVVRDRDAREVSLRLPKGDAPRFIYLGSYSASEIWPPVSLPPPAPSWQTLSAVAIQSQASGDDKPLVVAKVWRQQRADCEYDIVIQDCRGMP